MSSAPAAKALEKNKSSSSWVKRWWSRNCSFSTSSAPRFNKKRSKLSGTAIPLKAATLLPARPSMGIRSSLLKDLRYWGLWAHSMISTLG